MAHNVIEVDAHTTPIVVPDGADSRSNAAEVIQDLTQALANRTNRLNLHAAFKNLVNTFTAANNFQALVQFFDGVESLSTDATEGGFIVRGKPSDDAHVGNKYKFIFGANVGSCYINFYSGEVGGSSQLLLTLNAVWNVSAQNWHKDSTGDAALALIFDVIGGTAQFCIQHGAGTWTSWVPDDMNLTAGVGVFQTLLVSANAGVGGDASVTGNIDGGADLHVTGVATADSGFISGADYLLHYTNRVKYVPLGTVFKRVSLVGISDSAATAVRFDGAKWVTTATGYCITIPLGRFANLSEVVAVWLRYSASGADGVVEFVRSDVSDWGTSPSGATPSVTTPAGGSAVLTTTGSGIKTALATLSSPEVLNSSVSDYFIRITGDPGSTHTIWAAAVSIKLYSPGID